MSAKGLEVFLPLYDSARRWSDRNKTVSLPLFPGYVFFRNVPNCRTRIFATPGIHMILYHGAEFAHIPESEIAAVRKLIAGPNAIAPCIYLRCGDRVRIRRGALEGLEGILLRQKNQCRLVVSVEMLSQSVSVDVDVCDVERSPAVRRAPTFGSDVSRRQNRLQDHRPMAAGSIRRGEYQ
jgi:transcription antitermination factor NusG